LLVNWNREGIINSNWVRSLAACKKKKKTKKERKKRQKPPRGTERLPQTIELAWQLGGWWEGGNGRN